MKNKYNVQIIVPILYKKYDILLPVNKTVGETIYLLRKALIDLSRDTVEIGNNLRLYNPLNIKPYDLNSFIFDTDIMNGSILILC